MQALTALSMVEPSQRWILNPGPLQEALAPGTSYTDQASPSPSDQESAQTQAASEAEATLSRCRAGLAHSTVVLSSSNSSSQTIATGCHYTDLVKQHAAAHAHALLSQLDPEAKQRATIADDVFHRLLGLGEPSQLSSLLRRALQIVILHTLDLSCEIILGSRLDG